MVVAEPYLVLECIGTVAFAVSGAAVAARAGMDWLGAAVAIVVALVPRLLAIRYSWSLPHLPSSHPQPSGSR